MTRSLSNLWDVVDVCRPIVIELQGRPQRPMSWRCPNQVERGKQTVSRGKWLSSVGVALHVSTLHLECMSYVNHDYVTWEGGSRGIVDHVDPSVPSFVSYLGTRTIYTNKPPIIAVSFSPIYDVFPHHLMPTSTKVSEIVTCYNWSFSHQCPGAPTIIYAAPIRDGL